MRGWCAALLLSLAAAAHAGSSTLRVHEQISIEIPGATAAYAIDPSLVDVALLRNGVVQLTGRSAGSTQLIAVTAGGSSAFLITIAQSVSIAPPPHAAANGTLAHEELRYSSAPRQTMNAFDVFTQDGDRRSQFHLLNIHYFGETFAHSHDVIPSAFYRVTTPNRELTLLDDYVDVSPLTVANTQLRGIHLVDRFGGSRSLELHAGYAASTMYDDLFLPADRRWVAGAGYSFPGAGIVWTPSLYGYFSEPRNTSAKRGAIASIAAERRNGDTFDIRGELGVSNGIGASMQFRYDTQRDRAHGRFTFKPDDFPTLGLADLRGTHADADWSHRATNRLSFDTFGTFDRFRIGSTRQTSGAFNGDVRYALTRSLAATSGIYATDVHLATENAIRTISVPVGLAFDAPAFGASATYRTIDTTGASRQGDALRVTARATTSTLQFSAWAERQRQAPTLSLIFREEPGLELALLRLGISVHTPEDVARVLRDNAVLVNLGYIDGVTVNFAPKRTQAGFDASWIAGANRIRLHAITVREEGVRNATDGTIATLSYSRHIAATTEIYGSYTRFKTNDRGGNAVEAGVRTNIDRLPDAFRRNSTITGTIVVDPDATPLADDVVMLDDTRSTRTDAHGAYTFHDVPPGKHRISAQLPPQKSAYFTTPSSVTVEGGGRFDFHLIWTPARVSGRVMSDAKIGIGGAAITVGEMRTTTDSDGNYAVNVAAGTYRVALAPESLPPGYTIAGSAERDVNLAADQPQQLDFDVHALRSIAGKAPAGSDVTLAPLGRTAVADAEGRFIFRSLPAGTFTVAARSASTRITLPTEPASLSDVDLSAAPPPQIASAPQATSDQDGEYMVQVGAYREAANADETSASLRQLGLEPIVVHSGSLIIIRTGPFHSQSAARVASERLRKAGLDALILPR